MQMQLRSTLITLSLVAAPASATTLNEDDEWANLDRELEKLVAPASQSPTGFDVSGLFRTFYGFNDDTSIPAFLGDDLSGFFIDRAQVIFDGTVGDYGARVEIETAGSSVGVLDAYGSWQMADNWKLSVGNFRTPFLFEGNLREGDLNFLLRTDAGEFWSSRDPFSVGSSKVGAKAEARYDRFHVALTAQNGGNGAGESMALSTRAGMNILGDPITYQGAYGYDGDDRSHLSAAASFFDDDAVDDGDSYGFDIQFASGRFAAEAQYVDFGDVVLLVGGSPMIDPAISGSRAFAVAASFMIVPDAWELAARYQVTDNFTEDEDITIGVNRYFGPNVKWLFNYVDIFSDGDPIKDDEERILFGLSMEI